LKVSDLLIIPFGGALFGHYHFMLRVTTSHT